MTLEWRAFQAAVLLYTAASAAAFVGFGVGERRFLKWTTPLLAAGLLIHAAAMAARCGAFWEIPENHWFFPVNSFFGALSYFSFAIVAVFVVAARSAGAEALAVFVLPWGLVAAWGAWARGSWAGSTETAGLAPALQSYWMNIHPLLLLLSYAAFTSAFGASAALLARSRASATGPGWALLPDDEALDRLSYRLVAWFFPPLTVGITMGGLWAYGAWGRFWGWDPKETWALVTALAYAAFLHMRLVAGWKGAKSAWLSVFGFVCVLFTFLAVNFLSRLHGYLSAAN